MIKDHIGLYVNAFTEDLGEEGRAAIEFFLKKGKQIGIFPKSLASTLEISV